MKKTELTSIIILCVAVLVIIILPFCIDLDNLNLTGGFVGGILGTAIAAVVLLYVYETFTLEKAALEEQRKELQQTQVQIRHQQFEGTFFKMLEMLSGLSYNLRHESHSSGGIKLEHNGMDYFSYFLECLSDHYPTSQSKSFHKVLDYMRRRKLLPNQLLLKNSRDLPGEERHKIFVSWMKEKKENEKNVIHAMFAVCSHEQKHKLDNFFKYIESIFYLIANSYLKDKVARQRYVDILYSQLTTYQLTVLLYYGIAEFPRPYENTVYLHEDFDTYFLFRSVRMEHLISQEHTHYYPKTTFEETLPWISPYDDL